MSKLFQNVSFSQRILAIFLDTLVIKSKLKTKELKPSETYIKFNDQVLNLADIFEEESTKRNISREFYYIFADLDKKRSKFLHEGVTLTTENYTGFCWPQLDIDKKNEMLPVQTYVDYFIVDLVAYVIRRCIMEVYEKE